MKKLLKRYKVFFSLVFLMVIFRLFVPSIGQKAFGITLGSAMTMLSVLPPIFILLGLLDVWIERETMMKYMGEGSGALGILLSFIMGSVGAGPLYVGFPIAGVLLQKGSNFLNVLVFMGAWSTTKIPMLLFETSAMGWKFMLTRFILNLPVILLIALIIHAVLPEQEKRRIYEQADGN